MANVIERRADVESFTPMMKQYAEIKEAHDEYILLYRLGDFYECFFEDAIIASRELELTLTGRDCGSGKRAAMCGVPFHKADVYIGRLVEKGYKVAICEQVEDPKSAIGLVRREVTRVVTPGTITDVGILREEENNYLASVYFESEGAALSFADISTGEVFATFIEKDEMQARILNEMGAYLPKEAIINVSEADCSFLTKFLRDRCHALVNCNASRLFSLALAQQIVKDTYAEDSAMLSRPSLILACGALLLYIKETQKSDTTYKSALKVYSKGQYLEIDLNTRRNLELTESMRTKEKKGSLLAVIDRTRTAMGARLLRNWLLKPLLNPLQIMNRQSAVAELYKNTRLREELTEYLQNMLDIERLTAKAVYGTANAKDLRAICQSITDLPRIKELILATNSNTLTELAKSLDTLENIQELLDRAIVENPPHTIREGGMIKDGYNSDVDYYRSIRDNSREIIQSIEDREKEATGIRTLKVDYNKVFGYYIEVSKSFINDVPDRFIRKQTLTNCERYITQELKEIESAVLSADEKLCVLEYNLFAAIKDVIVKNSERIRKSAEIVAQIDVYNSLATVASKNSYVCPEVDLSGEIVINDGRHPVVEKFVSDSYFVPNDTRLDTKSNRMMIITGPNMAGKSTYMRQVAIITIMAQIGSFVPAKEAKIGIVDKVFTRVGASDDLASGQSTFMLEMNEVATILKNATKNSLIIYDEVGRGTSTFDGMAIARAVVEYTLSKKIGAKTLFATHYHELVDMEDMFEGIVNYNIAAKKRGDSIIFLRKIVKGGTDDSYGIEVAKLAGVPREVVSRAKEILADIERDVRTNTLPRQNVETTEPDLFTGIISSRDGEIIDKISSLDINTLTPIEAMNFLYDIKRMIKE